MKALQTRLFFAAPSPNAPRLARLLLALLTAALFSSGCVVPMTTKGEKFPAMYEEKPVVILALPPVNNSTAADAKEYYATTIVEPLAVSGFYVIPIDITAEILKSQGLNDTELIGDQPVARFGEYFGADAVLYTQINKWDKTYAVIAANLTISVSAKLKSTKTERTLWEYSGTVVVDLSGGSAGGGIAGLIAKAVVTAVSTAAADYVPYAMQANYLVLQKIPKGKYHPLYDKDREFKILDQDQPKKPSAKANASKAGAR